MITYKNLMLMRQEGRMLLLAREDPDFPANREWVSAADIETIHAHGDTLNGFPRVSIIVPEWVDESLIFEGERT